MSSHKLPILFYTKNSITFLLGKVNMNMRISNLLFETKGR